MKNGVTVKVSAKCMKTHSIVCEPFFIKEVCNAACGCGRKSTPNRKLLVYVPILQRAALRKRGEKFINGFMKGLPGGLCRFKNQETSLCTLHGTPLKPFGCIASPLTLTNRDTLIIQNRYRRLKCFKDKTSRKWDRLPVYRNFRLSFVLLFGEEQTEHLIKHFDNGGGDLFLEMKPEAYVMMKRRSKAWSEAA